MRVYSTDSLKVEFIAEEQRLYLFCNGNFNSTEFRDSLLASLQFAESNSIKQWLLDYREIGALNETDETWIQSHLFPRIMMTMGTGNYVAIVLSEKCYQALLKEAGLFGMQSYNSFIIMNTFSNPADAAAWLETQSISRAS
jgi:hypothetical protein